MPGEPVIRAILPPHPADLVKNQSGNLVSAGSPLKPEPRISSGVVTSLQVPIAIEASVATRIRINRYFQVTGTGLRLEEVSCLASPGRSRFEARRISVASQSVEALPRGVEEVADGVYLLRGDLKKGMNVYLVRGPDGELVQFDAGTRPMTKKARRAGEEMGGLDRVVLGHGHADHRGTAPGLGVPVFCHPDEVADAESPDSFPPYMDLSMLEVAPVRLAYRVLLPWWDGGPVEIAGTVEEGDTVAGFEVIHFPGHAPGLIGLWREADRVALVSDTIYVVDSARLRPLPEGEASVPHPAWAWDHQKAKQSVRKLAELHPKMVLSGHGDPLVGEDLHDVLIEASEKF